MGCCAPCSDCPRGLSHWSTISRSFRAISNTDPDPLQASFPFSPIDPKQISSSGSSVWPISRRARVDALSVDETQKQLALILDVSVPVDPKKEAKKILKKTPKKAEEKPERGPAALPAIARSEQGRYIMKRKKPTISSVWKCGRILSCGPAWSRNHRAIVSELALKPKKCDLPHRAEWRTHRRHRGQVQSGRRFYRTGMKPPSWETPSGNFTQAIQRLHEQSRRLVGIPSAVI